MDYLALYSPNCKNCGYLDGDEKRKFEKCHYTNGNTECPAKEVQFAVVGEAKRFANAFKRARQSGDLNKQAEILEAVAKRSLAFQHKFKDWSAK
jgi:hypothetical protein